MNWFGSFLFDLFCTMLKWWSSFPLYCSLFLSLFTVLLMVLDGSQNVSTITEGLNDFFLLPIAHLWSQFTLYNNSFYSFEPWFFIKVIGKQCRSKSIFFYVQPSSKEPLRMTSPMDNLKLPSIQSIVEFSQRNSVDHRGITLRCSNIF